MFLARELDTAASRVVLDAPIALDTHEPQGLRAAFFLGVAADESSESLEKSLRDAPKPEKGSSGPREFNEFALGAKVMVVMLVSSWPLVGHFVAVIVRLPGACVMLAPLTSIYWGPK